MFWCEGFRSPGTGVIQTVVSCRVTVLGINQDQGPLEDQSMLLTSEPSLQPQCANFNSYMVVPLSNEMGSEKSSQRIMAEDNLSPCSFSGTL